MKYWCRLKGVRITAFIVCVLSLMTAVIGVYGVVDMINMGIYTQPVGDIIEKLDVGDFKFDIYDIIERYDLKDQNEQEELLQEYSSDNSNLRFRFSDAETDTVITQNDYDEFTSSRIYEYYVEAHYSSVYDMYLYNLIYNDIENADYIMRVYVTAPRTADDSYARSAELVSFAFMSRYWMIGISVISIGICVLSFLILSWGMRRRNIDDGYELHLFEDLPIEVFALAALPFSALSFPIYRNMFYFFELGRYCWQILFFIIAACLIVTFGMALVYKIRHRRLFNNSVIVYIIELIYKGLKIAVPVIWDIAKTVYRYVRRLPTVLRCTVAVCISIAVDIILLCLALGSWRNQDTYITLFFIKNFIIGGFMIYAAYSFGILKDSSKHIAKGYTDWYVDSDTLIGDFKSIGEDLNSISDGINTTLEQRLTTERTKTRFIANVSNGIKKPLASIINYTDLISKESDPVKIKEYSGVLVRNSERLKHLLGGLVELSNAVTGDLEVEAVSCDAGTLIDQVAAEFDERCSNAGLNLITSVPDIPLNITVDRNCILKVFDNLMSNVCKYSLPGSRVYLTLEKADDNVRFVIRNTSGKALNLSSDELMESLTRGDTACFDEEYGLDLCIANTLTKLQNGSMDIAIDGDLFKVTLEFPCL